MQQIAKDSIMKSIMQFLKTEKQTTKMLILINQLTTMITSIKINGTDAYY